MIIWNPWHGCHKVNEGCQHCYMYFLDGKRGIDTSKVYRTENVSKARGEHEARFNAIPSAGNIAEKQLQSPCAEAALHWPKRQKSFSSL